MFRMLLCVRIFLLCSIVFLLELNDLHSVEAQNVIQPDDGPCARHACYPPVYDLLFGRKTALSASSTCGTKTPERYCDASCQNETRKCFICDSRQPYAVGSRENSHRVENIVDMDETLGKNNAWWQSENGVSNVSIRLDLETEFLVTHMVITFKTIRPAAMFIERSRDNGKTWQVYRYFADNCDVSFPKVSKKSPRSVSEVVCEETYSKITPAFGGELVLRVLPRNVPVDDADLYVGSLLSVTNLRLNFNRLHKPACAENTNEVSYAISEMVIRGSCSCNGHADRCIPLGGLPTDFSSDVVHGKCQCRHNTKGINCDECQDMYNDLSWKPAVGEEINACKRCTCNGHADACHFDPALYAASGNVSGGVCDGCRDNTMGRNCEMCRMGFHRAPDRPIWEREACLRDDSDSPSASD